MFTLPARIKETSILRSHYYIVNKDIGKKLKNSVELLNNRYLIKAHRGFLLDHITTVQLLSALKCELFLYLGFHIVNFKEWMSQIDMNNINEINEIVNLFGVPINEAISNNLYIPIEVKRIKQIKFEEIDFINHINLKFKTTNIHYLLSNILSVLYLLYKSTSYFSKEYTLFNEKQLNYSLSPILPSIEDWICYEYILYKFTYTHSPYKSLVDPVACSLTDTLEYNAAIKIQTKKRRIKL